MEQVAAIQDEFKKLKKSGAAISGASSAGEGDDGGGSAEVGLLLERMAKIEMAQGEANQTLGSVSNVSRKLVETVARHDRDVGELKKELRTQTSKLGSGVGKLEATLKGVKERVEANADKLTVVEGIKSKVEHLGKLEGDVVALQNGLERMQVDVKSNRTVSEALVQDIEDMQQASLRTAP